MVKSPQSDIKSLRDPLVRYAPSVGFPTRRLLRRGTFLPRCGASVDRATGIRHVTKVYHPTMVSTKPKACIQRAQVPSELRCAVRVA